MDKPLAETNLYCFSLNKSECWMLLLIPHHHITFSNLLYPHNSLPPMVCLIHSKYMGAQKKLLPICITADTAFFFFKLSLLFHGHLWVWNPFVNTGAQYGISKLLKIELHFLKLRKQSLFCMSSESECN